MVLAYICARLRKINTERYVSYLLISFLYAASHFSLSLWDRASLIFPGAVILGSGGWIRGILYDIFIALE